MNDIVTEVRRMTLASLLPPSPEMIAAAWEVIEKNKRQWWTVTDHHAAALEIFTAMIMVAIEAEVSEIFGQLTDEQAEELLTQFVADSDPTLDRALHTLALEGLAAVKARLQ